MQILGWIVWGLACFWTVPIVSLLVETHKYRSRIALGIYIPVLFAGILVTGMTGLSKLHLLWFAPAAYLACSFLGICLGTRKGIKVWVERRRVSGQSLEDIVRDMEEILKRKEGGGDSTNKQA